MVNVAETYTGFNVPDLDGHFVPNAKCCSDGRVLCKKCAVKALAHEGLTANCKCSDPPKRNAPAFNSTVNVKPLPVYGPSVLNDFPIANSEDDTLPLLTWNYKTESITTSNGHSFDESGRAIESPGTTRRIVDEDDEMILSVPKLFDNRKEAEESYVEENYRKLGIQNANGYGGDDPLIPFDMPW